MHSLRCLRMMQLKTFIVVGFITVSITFILLLYYSSSQPEVIEPPESILSKLIFQHHQQLQKRNKTLQVIKENDVFYNAKDSRPAMSVARLAKYCNRAHNHMEGQEGLAPPRYKLLAVHAVIRHGDRSPIYKLPRGFSGELSCLMNTEQHSHVSKIVNYPSIMTAEMTKNPPEDKSFLRWSLFPSHDLCGEGQLTGQGAIQHILNGMHFSERYVHKHNLFSNNNWENNVLIHSTEVSRTYQSAIAFAYGMLPTFDINKLKVKTSMGVNFCEDRVFGRACQCPKMEEFKVKAEAECKKDPQIKKAFQEYKRLLSHVSKVLDIFPTTVPSPSSLMDGLSGYTCHDKPFPCSVNGSCITTGIMEALWKIIDTKSDCLGRSNAYNTHGRALMHGLLYRIARNFNVSSSNASNASFHLYSGHDTTVTPLIAALELTDNVWPGYAHRITFELWLENGSKEKYIKVLQNGRVVTHQVVFCKDKIQDSGMCNFKHFLNYLRVKNLRAFCFSSNSETQFM